MKRMVWTAATILLTAALILPAGCPRKRLPPGPAPAKRITFWHIQTSSVTRKVTEDAVGRYEGNHEDVAVRTTACKNDLYKQKLSQAMASANVPDVFHTWGGGMLASFVDDRQVTDLTSAVEAAGLTKRILPAALEFGKVRGKIYAVPMDVSVVVMWYNRKLFEKHHVTVPTTFEELKSACEKLRNAGITPIALGNKDKWPGAFYFIYLATRLGGTQPFKDAAGRAPGGTFEHPSFIEAGRKLQELTRAEVFNKGASVLTYDDARGLFINEKAAMMLMGTWFLADLRSDAPELLDKVDCFAFPVVRGGTGKPNVIVGGINAAYAISSRCLNKEEAFGLLEELVSDTTAKQWGETGRIPALNATVISPLLEKHTLKAALLLFGAPEIQLYYDQYLPPALAELHKTTTQSLIAGTTTPTAAARDMETLARETAANSKTGAP